MADDKAQRQPAERNTTDESLRAERRKTDAELSGTMGKLKVGAAAVVADAREKADDVLRRARSDEDRKIAGGARSDASGGRVTTERAHEDAVLSAQRSGADANAYEDAASREEALRRLLALEREDTDLRLEIERAASDVAIDSREDFLAMVSHDLRSLLGGIAVSADSLQQLAKKPDANPKIARDAASIQRFAARMNRLLGDLMDVTAIDAGRFSLDRSPHDAGELVRESFDAFRPLAHARQIELISEIPAGKIPIDVDSERILQVLANVLGNAIKFTPEGGTITIGTAPKGGGALLWVRDSGEGIPADRLEKIFERFFQAHTSDRRGLGLGLYIARSIVTAHGGRIWAESPEGHGSVFTIELPSTQPPQH